MSVNTTNSDFKSKIYWLVWNIPFGKCISYGELSALAGSPRASRIVGGIAHHGPVELPWHRVVQKSGKLARRFPGGVENQLRLLKEEEVDIDEQYQILNVDKHWWHVPEALTTPLVVIVGETASGKSEIAKSLAKAINGSIVCADAWTVRKGMDIGTAKPNDKDRSEIPHYMLDLVGPSDYFTVADFQRKSLESLNLIVAEGRLPIIVGGNGLYVDSLLYGYSFLSYKNDELRDELGQKTLIEIQERANSLEIDTSEVDSKNKRRLIRLIETNGQKPQSSVVIRPNTLILGLRLPKVNLKKRIEIRINRMFEAGLEAEVEALAQEYGWGAEALKGIGYREFKGYFDGERTHEEVKGDIRQSTLKLAKKQRTWFRRYKEINWAESAVEVNQLVSTFLKLG